MSSPEQKYNVPVFKKNQPDDNDKFQPAPNPTGQYPYHLNLNKIQTIVSQQKLVFHMLGDSGSMRKTDFLKQVTGQLVKQFDVAEMEENQPRFLYHLGDVVYNHGEESQYRRQFFEPFQAYPAPIVAIPGNHDSDINPDNPLPYRSLAAFTNVFCNTTPQTVAFSDGANRKSMIQPNVYWTLETPLANIIGLYSNVPKFGIITSEQRSWLIKELKRVNLERTEKAVILCLHHSPYSADVNHGSSIPMIQLLEGVYAESGVRPDIVFSGHVHNYQRFAKVYSDGQTTPYIVAGSGGYDELHPIASVNDDNFTSENSLFKDVELKYYCDNQHGFLKITLEKTDGKLTLTGEYYIIQLDSNKPKELNMFSFLADRFVVKI